MGIPYCGTQIECKLSTFFEISKWCCGWLCCWLLHVSGEVIFDRNHPTQPPDIIFSPQDELLEFDPDIEKLKVRKPSHFISRFTPTHNTYIYIGLSGCCDNSSIFPKLVTFHNPCCFEIRVIAISLFHFITVQCFSRWNGRNPNCLSNLLQELLSEYRSHHRALACQYQRLNFELQTLLDSGQFQDVDVHCTRRTDSVG